MMAKLEIFFNPPTMNAAGTLGFSPNKLAQDILPGLGGFVTNPLSLAPRTPARGPRFHPFPGGALLHTGLPNPGLAAAIRRHAERWARCPIPVIVHLIAETPEGVARMVCALEEVDGVAGIELGLPPAVSPPEAAAFTAAAVGERELIVRLALDQRALAPGVVEAGAGMISLGPPRGETPHPVAGVTGGRLYGPGLFPLGLAALRQLIDLGIPVIAGAGIYTPAQAAVCLEAGALAVQLDTVLWRDGFWSTPAR